MKHHFGFILIMIWVLCPVAKAQSPSDSTLTEDALTEEEIDNYKKEVRDLVSFYSYLLNILGDPSNPSSYKQTIVDQSYLKIFEGPEVQIEDDLIAERSTMTNKDVQAYLKDVDFFFENVTFEHDIAEIQMANRGESGLFFLVESTRIMAGRYASGDTVQDQKPRYFEVNLNLESREIKIASIYTTGEALKPALTSWYNNLNQEWRLLLGGQLFINDSLRLADLHQKGLFPNIGDTLTEVRHSEILVDDSLVLKLMGYKGIKAQIGDTIPIEDTTYTHIGTPRLKADLKHLIALQKLELSGLGLSDIRPLEQFEELEALDLSANNITNIFPLRQLKGLNKVDLSQNPIASTDALKYLSELDSLDLSDTKVKSTASLRRLGKLRYLSLDRCPIEDFGGLGSLENLEFLSLNNENFENLSLLSGLEKLRFLRLNQSSLDSLVGIEKLGSLEELEIAETAVGDLSPLQNLTKLRYLNAAQTRVKDLSPVSNILSLREVDVNETLISAAQVRDFQKKNDYVTIFFNTKELKDWWEKIPEGLRAALRSQGNLNEADGRGLHKLLKIKSLDLSELSEMRQISHLRSFQQLQHLDLSGSGIVELKGIQFLKSLQTLDISHTQVSNLSHLDSLDLLKVLRAAETGINSLDSVVLPKNLEELYLNQTEISGLSSLKGLKALRLIEANETRLSTDSVWHFLQRSPHTNVIFRQNELEMWWYSLPAYWQKALGKLLEGSPENSHVLHRFASRKNLELEANLRLNNVQPLAPFFALEELVLDDMGIRTIGGIEKLKHLKSLSLSKNPLDDLKPLSGLKELSYLDISNTAIQSLEALEKTPKLKALICSGNQLKNLHGLENLRYLEHLDCSSSRIKSLSPIMGLVHLKTLNCTNTNVSKGKVAKFRDKHPLCDITYY